MKSANISIFFLFFSFLVTGQENYSTYCNPVNLDYAYMIDMDFDDVSYRSGADPQVVKYRGEYYLFVSRSMGYWHSNDLNNWEFIKPKKWYLEGSLAPTAHNHKDSLLYLMGNPYGSMSVLFTDDPKMGDWKAEPSILNRLKDPELFITEEGNTYLFSSAWNQTFLQGKELDRNRSFRPEKDVRLYELNPELNGWERFKDKPEVRLQEHIRGPEITENNNKYYLQYGVPGTSPNLYADAALIADNPLGPYELLNHNPVSFKPGGFITGAGNSSVVEEKENTWWRFATMNVAANSKKEQRIGMFRTHFDEEGQLWTNTYFGDYPHYAPTANEKQGEFTGWMLLSHKKPVKASSETGGSRATNVVDEDIKTFWLAGENDEEQWLEIDMEKSVTVNAVQINFHDHLADRYGKINDLHHRYIVEASKDGNSWRTIVDKSESNRDTPHDYTQLPKPEQARFIRYRNKHVPSPHLAVSGLRIFGDAGGRTPANVRGLEVKVTTKGLNASVTWKTSSRAMGYNVLWGTAPNKLFNSWMVYDQNQVEIPSLTKGQTYYFAVEAFNESGISRRTKPVKVN